MTPVTNMRYVYNLAILDGRTWSKFGEHGEHGEHGKDGNHQPDDLKTIFIIQNTLFMTINTLFVNQITQNTLFYCKIIT